MYLWIHSEVAAAVPIMHEHGLNMRVSFELLCPCSQLFKAKALEQALHEDCSEVR